MVRGTLNTLRKWSLSNLFVPNYLGLPKEHLSKWNGAKPIEDGSHSKSVSLVNLVVLQTRFQSHIIRLKGMPAKASLVEAHSEEEKWNKSQTAKSPSIYGICHISHALSQWHKWTDLNPQGWNCEFFLSLQNLILLKKSKVFDKFIHKSE